MAKAVVALGKRLKDDGTPTDILTTRMALACEVFKHECDSGDYMMVTGGKPADLPRSEAEVMRDLALGRELGQHAVIHCEDGEVVTCEFGGLREDQLIIEDKARTTVENAFLIREKLIKLGVNKVYLITDDFHMRRSYFIFNYIMATSLDEAKLSGLSKVLEPALNGHKLELPLNERVPVVIRCCANEAPISDESRVAEYRFEEGLPNDKMLKIIKQVLEGTPETIGNNAADKMHKSDAKTNLEKKGTCNMLKAAHKPHKSVAMPQLPHHRPKVRRAVVALGKRLKDDGKATDVLTSRMSIACEVFRKYCTGLDDVMLVTGGKPADHLPRSEAEVMRDIVLGREFGTHAEVHCEDGEDQVFEFGGLEEKQIILEDKARTTVENCILIRERLEELNIQEIYLVTDDFHMRRAHFIFEYILHEQIDASHLQGLEKVLAPTLNGRSLKIKLNSSCPCAIQVEENHAPILKELKDKENQFEDSLPNSKMMEIIHKVMEGVPEIIGSNAADLMQKSSAQEYKKTPDKPSCGCLTC